MPVDQEQLILFRRLLRADGALLRPAVNGAALLASLRLRRRRAGAGRQPDGTPTPTLSGGGEAEQKAVDGKENAAVVDGGCGAAAAAAAAAAAGAAAPETASSDSNNAVDTDSPEVGIDVPPVHAGETPPPACLRRTCRHASLPPPPPPPPIPGGGGGGGRGAERGRMRRAIVVRGRDEQTAIGLVAGLPARESTKSISSSASFLDSLCLRSKWEQARWRALLGTCGMCVIHKARVSNMETTDQCLACSARSRVFVKQRTGG